MKKFLALGGIAATSAIAASQASAAVDVAAAVTEIEGASTPLLAVGAAMIGVAVVVYVIKLVRSMV